MKKKKEHKKKKDRIFNLILSSKQKIYKETTNATI